MVSVFPGFATIFWSIKGVLQFSRVKVVTFQPPNALLSCVLVSLVRLFTNIYTCKCLNWRHYINLWILLCSSENLSWIFSWFAEQNNLSAPYPVLRNFASISGECVLPCSSIYWRCDLSTPLYSSLWTVGLSPIDLCRMNPFARRFLIVFTMVLFEKAYFPLFSSPFHTCVAIISCSYDK